MDPEGVPAFNVKDVFGQTDAEDAVILILGPKFNKPIVTDATPLQPELSACTV